MWRSTIILLLTVGTAMSYPAEAAEVAGAGNAAGESAASGMTDLGEKGKSFFADIAKQLTGLDSLNPADIGVQKFFRAFLDKFTNLDESTKKELEQYIPSATKVFNDALSKLNIDPMQAFQTLAKYFEEFKKGASSELIQQGVNIAANVLSGKAGAK
ncbi:unnamed protein product [Cylicocyclus nassatus]|uniref:Uncharacterized protein n=1 Tax=Cylicocyclus nassatus TaxID=53992 RepID=A0AA36GR78_CYLNA|nr:unnamed protein product [Cylicocyclus nassatus]